MEHDPNSSLIEVALRPCNQREGTGRNSPVEHNSPSLELRVAHRITFQDKAALNLDRWPSRCRLDPNEES